MSRLSPDSLFHFTPHYKNLIGILENTFYPRYCYDEFDLVDNDQQPFIEDAVPMVCFCDIPLSQLISHINTYGKYGLGMSKEWGIRRGLNPVIYFNKNSYLAKKLSLIVNSTRWIMDNPSREPVNEAMMYFKPYEGTLYRSGHSLRENVRFYDEHEWRYMPDGDIMIENSMELSIQGHLYRNTEYLANANRKLETDITKLSFNADDIKYVIIKEENQINEMVKALRQIKGNRYDRNTIDRLTSRIITVKQIQDDF